MTKKEFIRRLQKAKKLLQKGWTKHAAARDKRGNHIGVFDDKATKWCLMGALGRAGLACHYEAVFPQGVNHFQTLPAWNDYAATHKTVVACIDNSIAALRK